MNRCRIILALTCFAAGFGAVAAESVERAARLTGVAVVNGKPLALLEIPNPRTKWLNKPILAAAERTADFEVVSIDAATGRVQAKHGGEETVLALPTASDGDKPRTLQLHSADYVQVLDIYQSMAGRTILRPDNLPGMKISLSTDEVPDGKALSALDEAFTGHGILLRPHGARFIYALRTNDVGRLAFVPPLPSGDDHGKDAEVLPPGMIKFQDADHRQVLEIYQELTGRTVLMPTGVRWAKVSVKTQTEMTRDEAIWMLEAVFALSDIAVVPRGEKFALVAAPAAQRPLSDFKANEVSAVVGVRDSFPPGMLKFSSADTAQVLSVYASLLGREVQPPVPPVKLSMRNQTELSRSDALYALEALAALNHLRLELVGDKYVKAVLTAPVHPPSRSGPQ